MQKESVHPLLLFLQEQSKQLFGFNIVSFEEITLGWLNLKWKLETDQGKFLLKLYHTNRYKSADVLNRALRQQQKLHLAGLPCPELISNNDGSILHSFLESKYILMRFCEGTIVKPQSVNLNQMYELGCVTGKMHKNMNDGSFIGQENVQFIPQSREERMKHWSNIIEEAKNNGKMHCMSDIELHMKLTETIVPSSFERAIPGWCHRDLWVDNVLFGEDKVTAILDFDRFNYDYLELDIAWAIMSWAYFNGVFYTEHASSFLQGYRSVHEFSAGHLVNSLRMLWYMESVWWINLNMENENAVQVRFAEEMNWIAKNYEQLPLILGDL